MKLEHLVESQQFTVPLLTELFERTRGMERVVARGGSLDFHQKIMASLFYRPSTRTRLSFEAAMHRLGGRVISTDQADAFSSEVGGERLEDTIKTISGFADVIVLRSPEMGGAARAASVASVPVVNAGDGSGGQHPTQALLDLYTIKRERGSLDGLTIAMIGELDQGRTVRSLAYLLSKFDRVKMYFVSPPEQRMKEDILAHLDERKVWYSVESDMEKVIGEVDVVYLTQIRPDGLADREGSRKYVVDSSILGRMREDSMILHPLPRTQ
ncbi:MAG: aspartate carbamoyltransferase, partial [Myxococcota bacterium]